MSLRVIKPTTPGQRNKTSQDFSEITANKPVKSLLKPIRKKSGRNHRGVITSRRRGGGAKRHYRLISFNLPVDFKAVVKEVEYDPNRSVRIARLLDDSGKFYYILAPKNIKIGDEIRTDSLADIESGHRMNLAQIPIGSFIHNIELKPNKGGQIVRSAGTVAQLTAKDEKYAHVKLPSGEIRLFHLNLKASVGILGNEQHKNIKLGKAGRSRHIGRRPKVRGVATNPSDHPHGGGEGKTKGYKTPRTPWGSTNFRI